jgi:hypothetical protein
MKVKKPKLWTVIPVVMIILGIASMIFWEAWGRENILDVKVVVANADIMRGMKITDDMLTEKSFARDTVITDAMRIKDKEKIVGQVAKQNIPKNGQINQSFLYKDNFYVGKGQSIYKIPADWIDNRSASIRRGDTIQIYAGDLLVGEYLVAFVKDKEEREVTSTESQWYSEALDRTNSTGVISNIEIIATMAEYKELYKVAVYNPDSLVTQKLLIVQKLGVDAK